MKELVEFRHQNGLTQEQLGQYLGMKKSFISKIENGRERFPADKFQKLLNNENGWDVSVLKNVEINKGFRRIDLWGMSDLGGPSSWMGSEKLVNIVGPKTSGAAKLESLWDENIRLKKQIEDLRTQIDQLKKQTDEYWEMIKKLTDK